MTVTFCGHSQTSDQDKIANWLDTVLPALIEDGVTMFSLGGYGDFDRLAAAAVKRQKTSYPYIESVLVLPYLNSEFDSTSYDNTTYSPLEKVPPRHAIVKRNQWMVSESDVVISGVIHSWGGAAKTLDFARSKQAGRETIIVSRHPCKNLLLPLCC